MDEALKEKKLLGNAVIELGAVLIVAHLIAVITEWYHTHPWIDIPQHFFGGVFAALIFYWITYRFPRFFKLIPSFPIPVILVLGWTALLGVLFEFTEFTYDLVIFDYLGLSNFQTQLGVRDTMGDLFFDLMGGLFLAIFMRLRYDGKKRQL